MAADTYTPILGLILQGTGNNDNTWGDNLNEFCIQYIEDAIAGRSAITVTSGDVTLTEAQARSAILDCSGTLTGNRALIVPNASKKWTIRNNTSGAFTLSVKTASGAAVVLPQGGWCEVWCDGSNVVYMHLSTAYHLAQASGTAALPYYSWASDPDTGIYRIGADNIGISIGGTKLWDYSAALAALTGSMTISGDLAVAGALTQGGSRIVPIGATMSYDGIIPPAGWLLKYGQAVSRATFSALFEVLTVTATATKNGTTTLTGTGIGDTVYLYGLIGAYIEGTGINTGTTVATIVNSNTITISAAASGSGSITIRILPHGQGDGSTTFNIPDDRGVADVGRDNMGGTSANRLTGKTDGLDGDRLGLRGGEEETDLSIAQLPTITPAGTLSLSSVLNSLGLWSRSDATYDAGVGTQRRTPTASNNGGTSIVGEFLGSSSITTTGTFNGTPFGSGAAHNTVQPSRVTNKIIFTGVF